MKNPQMTNLAHQDHLTLKASQSPSIRAKD